MMKQQGVLEMDGKRYILTDINISACPLSNTPSSSSIPSNSSSPNIIDGSVFLSRNFNGYVVPVSTTPSLILQDSNYPKQVRILNPQRSSALTTTILAYATPDGGITTEGDSTLAPIAVSGVESVHVHLNVTSNTGSFDFDLLSYDSISGNWATVAQRIFSSITDIGTYYIPCGSIGIAEQLAFRWKPNLSGKIQFTIGVIRKNGLGGNYAAIPQVVYIGNNNGVSPSSGWPILEGHDETFTIDQGVPVWCVSTIPINLSVFQL